MITYLYLISYIMYTSARVAKPGQRRQVQGLISQEFLGSNPIPRIILFVVFFRMENCIHVDNLWCIQLKFKKFCKKGREFPNNLMADQASTL